MVPQCQPALPLRWVLVRPGDIVACFIKRWSTETTFEESRAHLDFETQRLRISEFPSLRS